MSTIENYSRRRARQPQKGTTENPYTVEEYEAMLDAGTWTGGFVLGLGYCGIETIIEGSSESNSSKDSSSEYNPDDDKPLIDPDDNDDSTVTDGGNGGNGNSGGNGSGGGTGGTSTGGTGSGGSGGTDSHGTSTEDTDSSETDTEGNTGDNSNNSYPQGGNQSGHGPFPGNDGPFDSSNTNNEFNILENASGLAHDLFHELPTSLQSFLRMNRVSIVSCAEEQPTGVQGNYSATENKIVLYNEKIDILFRECIHAAQNSLGMLGDYSNHLAVEFQEHIIGDLYLYLVREDINIPEGHMSGAYRTFNDENESLSSFFDLCVYQYQTVILSVWQDQVVGQYYPLFMLHNTTTTSYNTPFEPYEWKWRELFNILGINYSYVVSQ